VGVRVLPWGYLSRHAKIRKRWRFSPAFVTCTAAKPRLVIVYSKVNDCLDERTFSTDHLHDLAPSLSRNDSLFKADIRDPHYHLRLRKEDQLYLSFCVSGMVHILTCLNCGLSITPWFFTKAMRPVVAHLRMKVRLLLSYLGNFLGTQAQKETTSMRRQRTLGASRPMFDSSSPAWGCRFTRPNATSSARARWKYLGSS
jgi:hypothetical protein